MNWLDLQAIREAFERGGVEFRQNGGIGLLKIAVIRVRETTIAVLT